MQTDTIAAIGSGPAPGAIGIVRISGPASHAVARTIFRSRNASPFRIAQGRIRYGAIIDPSDQTAIDEALLLPFFAPRSYTGEDMVEFSCHGSPYILARVLRAALDAGCRAAEPGEFTYRAYLSGRLDLAQAEAVADLIATRSAAALHSAMDLRSGRLSQAVDGIRDRLLSALATLEASIEFSDDTLADSDQATAAIGEALAKVRELERTYRLGRIVRDGYRVAIIGRPNVGKSSLFNALAGRNRALVTPIPGTTRDVIEETITLGGFAVTLIDTAGIRHARGIVEAAGIVEARNVAAGANLVIVVGDARIGLRATDEASLTAAPAALIVLNKSDLVAPDRMERHRTKAAALYVGRDVLCASAKTGSGLSSIETALVNRMQGEQMFVDGTIVTNERHASELSRAGEHLSRAIEGLSSGQEVVQAAFDVREATDALGSITGVTTTEDIIRTIFSRFCVGK